MKRYTKLERTQLIQMVSQGKSDEDIARILGRSKSSVCTKRIGIFGATRKRRRKYKARKPAEVKTPAIHKLVGGGRPCDYSACA